MSGQSRSQQNSIVKMRLFSRCMCVINEGRIVITAREVRKTY